MNLYVKYRPKSLDGIVGNKEVVSTLENMLSDPEDAPQSFLLHGPTGCGKTTIGRIIAKRLGCKGNDLIELDTADFRGIDTIREVRKQSMYKPVDGNTRMWIIDECHQLTKDAQNALLKMLEDTPKHTHFVLCTTEPQKLLPTIKGRCSQFQLKPLSDNEMFRLLRKVTHLEGERLEKEVYNQIITDSFGYPRNAIQILEQVLKANPESRIKIAKQVAEEQSQSIALCRALVSGKSWKVVRSILSGLKDQDPESIRRHVLGYSQSVLLNGDNEKVGRIMEEFIDPFYNSGFPGLVYACYAVTKV